MRIKPIYSLSNFYFLNSSPLDREACDTYYLTVVAIDSPVNSRPLSASSLVIVQVVDENDNQPRLLGALSDSSFVFSHSVWRPGEEMKNPTTTSWTTGIEYTSIDAQSLSSRPPVPHKPPASLLYSDPPVVRLICLRGVGTFQATWQRPSASGTASTNDRPNVCRARLRAEEPDKIGPYLLPPPMDARLGQHVAFRLAPELSTPNWDTSPDGYKAFRLNATTGDLVWLTSNWRDVTGGGGVERIWYRVEEAECLSDASERGCSPGITGISIFDSAFSECYSSLSNILFSIVFNDTFQPHYPSSSSWIFDQGRALSSSCACLVTNKFSDLPLEPYH
ncbi:unnamed protein product [Protopolystoma xenopodis]|uniref:Cadherin domain-containing protein n=1 Tax=Protopolystoma xenopodis TaxID=117903 RepID=A0A3S5CFV9_9PLAT|nr:unnamed protein product [Protopolystoma xenopodis]